MCVFFTLTDRAPTINTQYNKNAVADPVRGLLDSREKRIKRPGIKTARQKAKTTQNKTTLPSSIGKKINYDRNKKQEKGTKNKGGNPIYVDGPPLQWNQGD